MNFDQFLNRKYNLANYNCWDFIREVYAHATGVTIRARAPRVLTEKTTKTALLGHLHEFDEVVPLHYEFCLVLLTGKRLPHIGMYNDGKIFHMPETGPRWDVVSDLERQFKKLRFYK